ncbi:ferritin-like domain-containing protein [Syntrophomonas palmitatica]|uniref:ferritin-like domain-containing protein n=1 Tax=Syntrophomonas palmitatica TaxID=402877 RepID=UPI0006D23BF5|nr:ferritin-like domain-containing protein [Syntrophomonas palmitatica]
MNLIEALQTALKDEAEAVANYRQMASQADDPETRVMHEQIAREEESHYKRLSERLKAIKLFSD